MACIFKWLGTVPSFSSTHPFFTPPAPLAYLLLGFPPTSLILIDIPPQCSHALVGRPLLHSIHLSTGSVSWSVSLTKETKGSLRKSLIVFKDLVFIDRSIVPQPLCTITSIYPSKSNSKALILIRGWVIMLPQKQI